MNNAVQEVDKKKARKRNLVPARIGVLQIIIYITTYTIFWFVYSACPLNLDAATRFFIAVIFRVMFIIILTRSFIINFYCDIIVCVVRFCYCGIFLAKNQLVQEYCKYNY